MGWTKRKLIGVYMIHNIINGKVYIGSSTNIKRKGCHHRNDLRRGVHGNGHLQTSWNKHGQEAFEFSTIELCAQEMLLVREEFWINFYNSMTPAKGYNCVSAVDRSVRRPACEVVKRTRKKYICINKNSGEMLEKTMEEIKSDIFINEKRVGKVCVYWAGKKKNGKPSTGGWIFVRPEHYNPDFDYINYNGVKEYRKNYVPKPKVKKEPKIRTYKNCKRTPILTQSLTTGENKEFRGVSEAIKDLGLVPTKVMKCLNAPFGKYSHHGYWFKRIDTLPVI